MTHTVVTGLDRLIQTLLAGPLNHEMDIVSGISLLIHDFWYMVRGKYNKSKTCLPSNKATCRGCWSSSRHAALMDHPQRQEYYLWLSKPHTLRRVGAVHQQRPLLV
jgi:hypothetical protein